MHATPPVSVRVRVRGQVLVGQDQVQVQVLGQHRAVSRL